jgi:hypothetical protein
VSIISGTGVFFSALFFSENLGKVLKAGLALKNPPKKTQKNPPEKTHQKCVFWVF